MKTKPFLLATAGSTVDGRVIDDKMIDQMASSYDPKTYGARLNIEHIRGVSGDKPFRAYGDVLSLSTGEVEVNFNGKTEKRKGLYGIFDVTEDAKQLNQADQKVYPSVEIHPDFGGKGFAYLMGCALTDSPASIATERLKFNRVAPGVLTLTGDAAAPLELEAEAAPANPDPTGIFASIKGLLDKFTPAPVEPAQPKVEGKPADPAAAAADPAVTALAAIVGQLAATTQQFIANSTDGQAKLQGEVAALKASLEKTPATGFTARPVATGGTGATKTDC